MQDIFVSSFINVVPRSVNKFSCSKAQNFDVSLVLYILLLLVLCLSLSPLQLKQPIDNLDVVNGVQTKFS